MKKYMVLANFENNEHNNLEVVDFDLTLEQAQELTKKISDDVESVCICEHGEFIYN